MKDSAVARRRELVRGLRLFSFLVIVVLLGRCVLAQAQVTTPGSSRGFEPDSFLLAIKEIVDSTALIDVQVVNQALGLSFDPALMAEARSTATLQQPRNEFLAVRYGRVTAEGGGVRAYLAIDIDRMRLCIQPDHVFDAFGKDMKHELIKRSFTSQEAAAAFDAGKQIRYDWLTSTRGLSNKARLDFDFSFKSCLLRLQVVQSAR